MSNKYIFSATEIDTFLLCKKRWALKYLEKKKEPETKAKKLGSDVHNALFNYLSNQKYDLHLGRIFNPGLGFLPKNLKKENLEKYFVFTKNNHIFHGYIDFYENIGSQKWLVGDHKTASSFSKIPNPEALKKNIQANMYAQYFFTEKDAQEITLRWVYYKTKGSSNSKCVEVSINKAECEENFKPILRAADEIAQIIKNEPPDFWPQNRSACFTLGKCSFFDICKNQKSEVFLKMPVSKNKTENFHLYLDCFPLKSDYSSQIELSELLKPVQEKINAEKNLKHYRLAGYGQHVGIMADYLSEYLKEHPLSQNTAVLSNTKSPEGLDTLQTLSLAASKIIKGY